LRNGGVGEIGEIGKMKRAIFLLWTFICLLSVSEGKICYLVLSPTQPTSSDVIELFAGGTTECNFANIDFMRFNAEGNVLQWDIYYSMGLLTIVDAWDASKSIGTFSPGSYELVVNVYATQQPYGSYYLDDRGYLTFNVVPEPATLLLAASGGLVFLFKPRKTR